MIEDGSVECGNILRYHLFCVLLTLFRCFAAISLMNVK
ncbi:hypothetical protein HMPREF1173_00731 [Prevotella nigrescens CC14M]|uniref:Uncharacterized protein n=1 Tax=Prevotella nigrescens CC14M TaxID=1073366 RepID=V8CPA3_9BACT|nr:hypothetical protein HMPREF1173_00731 [Prevotella nigrescens CC14M]